MDGLQAEVQQWIEAVLNISFTSDFHTFLKDGVVLCRLMNAIRPDTIKKVNKSAIPAFQMDNITQFIRALRGFGVAEQDLFGTVDLYEGRNMNAVLKGLLSFGRTIQRVAPEYTGPVIGIREVERREIVIEESKLQAAKAQPSRLTLGLSKDQLALDKSYPVSGQRETQGPQSEQTPDPAETGETGATQPEEKPE